MLRRVLLGSAVIAGMFLSPNFLLASESAASGANLVPNPSFETPNTDDSRPEGWSLSRATQEDPEPLLYPDANAPEWADDPGARTGDRYIKFVVGYDSTGYSTLVHESLIPITTDTDYRIQMAYRYEEVNEGAPSIEKSRIAFGLVPYYDANPGGEPDPQPFGFQVLSNQYIDSLCCGTLPPAEVTRWTLRERDVSFDGDGVEVDGVVRQVEWVQLAIEPNGWFEGTLAIDDLSMVELVSAEIDPPASSQAYDFVARQCDVWSSNASQNCLTDADCLGMDRDGDGTLDTEGICLTFDGTTGFTPVPFNWQFSGEGGDQYGFEFEGLENSPTGSHDDDYPTRFAGSYLDRNAKFRVALEPGEYRVSVFMGGYWRSSPVSEQHVLDFNGERLLDERDNWTEPYALEDHWYFKDVEATLVTAEDVAPDRRGFAVYDQYITPRYRRHDFNVTVSGEGEAANRLEIQNPLGFMSGVLITPVAAQAQHDAAIAAFETTLANEFVTHHAAYLPPENFGLPVVQGDYTPTQADTDRGYILFKRHWMDFVEFNSRPDTGEAAISELSITATPGEFEPATFSIWPQQQLENATIAVSDLLASGGAATIPSEAVQVWYLQQKPRRSGTTFSFVGVYFPDWGASRTLYPDITQRARLNLKVPEDIPAGTYTGQVTFAADGVSPTVLPLTVEVLPFRLQRPPHLRSLRGAGGSKLILGYPSSDPDVPGEEDPPIHNREYYRKAAYQDLYDHGFTPDISPYFGGSAGSGFWNGTSDFDWSYGTISGSGDDQLDRFAASPLGAGDTMLVDANIWKLLGAFEGNPESEWSIADAARFLAGIESKIHGERGIETIYLHASGEESHYNMNPMYEDPFDHPDAQAWLAFLDFMRTYSQTGYDGSGPWPHVYSLHTTNTIWGQPAVLENVDFPFLGMFHGVSLPPASQQVAAAKATGKPYGIYGLRGRYNSGFYHWKAGATGSYHEFYDPYTGSINDDWDSSNPSAGENPGWTNVIYSQSGRMVGSWYWEELREGVDDDAYLATLDYWIEKYECSENPTDACGDAILARQAIADAIDLDISEATFDPEDAESTLWYSRSGLNLMRPMEPEAFDALRGQAAAAIAPLLGPDADGDWTPDEFDNCPATANIGQEDTDGDGVGDMCNDADDSDGDEIADALDNCPADSNPDQQDTDDNGLGDTCNGGEDADGDGWADALDNCIDHVNPSQTDANFDGFGNDCDADFNDDSMVDGDDFVAFQNAYTATYLDAHYRAVIDMNANGEVNNQDFSLFSQVYNSGVAGISGLACAGAAPGDAGYPCRSRSDDVDGDGVADDSDTCPTLWNPSQQDICPDQDGDGVTDVQDNCPTVPNPGQEDSNSDLLGDACDIDVDGVADAVDNCPAAANADQANMDGDAEGDVCDADADGDYLLDAYETGTGIFENETDTGTDPWNPDSDGDGIVDGAEVIAGWDPNVADVLGVPSLAAPLQFGLVVLMITVAVGVLRKRGCA